MPKSRLSYEQKQINDLLAQFLRIHNRHLVAILLVIALMHLFPFFWSIGAVTALALGCLLFAGLPLLWHWRRREKAFLRGLTDSDLALLHSVATSDAAEFLAYRQTAYEVLAARTHHAFSEGSLLLRASNVTHDAYALLHPITNDAAPPDEMLRASQER